MKAISKFAIVLASCGLLACTGDTGPGDDTAPPGSNPGGSSEDPDNTFEHPDFNNPFDDVGSTAPASYMARIHGCTKMRYDTLGRVLASRGIDLNSGIEFTAGDLWQGGTVPLGTANYAARIRENISLTTSAAARIFDIFIAAAPEIEVAMAAAEGVAACSIAGNPVSLFNADNTCTIGGIECITGVNATAQHLAICNESVVRALDANGDGSSIDEGKAIAVATLMAAAHTCE
jgi:hypothetical protein